VRKNHAALGPPLPSNHWSRGGKKLGLRAFLAGHWKWSLKAQIAVALSRDLYSGKRARPGTNNLANRDQ
jgi:hypothetical protein